MTCPRCHQQHDRCAAHRRDGSPCRQPPISGLDKCRMHVGKSGAAARAEGERRLQEAKVAEQIRDMLATYQPDVDTLDLHAQLLEVVALTSGMRRVLTVLVGELAPVGTPAYQVQEYDDEGKPRGGPTYLPAKPAGIYGPDHQGDGRPHVLVEMLRHWTAENAKATKLALDAGIDERRVRIHEQQANQITAVLRAALAAVMATVRDLVDDAGVVRRLHEQLPGIVRAAIESAGVIDTTATEE